MGLEAIERLLAHAKCCPKPITLERRALALSIEVGRVQVGERDSAIPVRVFREKPAQLLEPTHDHPPH
jgi:hypothetical protein